jgi:hypothetical protein
MIHDHFSYDELHPADAPNMDGTALHDQLNQLRIEREILNIHSALQNGYFEQGVITEISPRGDVITTKTRNSFATNGEIIHDPQSQLVGQCQTCGEYTTRRTTRVCANPNCQLILCPDHCKYHEKEGTYFCLECFKAVRVKRFLLLLAWIVVAPLVERIES